MPRPTKGLRLRAGPQRLFHLDEWRNDADASYRSAPCGCGGVGGGA